MSRVGRKRSISDEHRGFQEKWTEDYLCVPFGGKIFCLVCHQIGSVMKKFNVERHYTRKHEQYESITNEHRENLIPKLKIACDASEVMLSMVNKREESDGSDDGEQASCMRMADKEYHSMAEAGGNRYVTEAQNHTPPKVEKQITRGKKRKHNKDPNKPKRPLSAFFWYCSDERGELKRQNPTSSMVDMAKELGKKWSNIAPETKSKYEAMAEKDKGRYEKDMIAYNEKTKAEELGVGAVPVAIQHTKDEWPEDDQWLK